MRLILLLLSLIVLSVSASAEERVWRLGVLTPFDWPADATMHGVMIPELARRGFVEGKNLVVLPHWGDPEQLARLAQELAATKPDVIVAVAPRAISAAMKAAPQIPIVASFTTDPVIEGEAASISRPGGQVTGIALLTFDGDKKRMELLHDAIPGAGKFALLVDERTMTQQKEEYRQIAEKVGVELLRFEVKSPADYQTTFDAMLDAGVDGIVIQSSPNFHRDAPKLAALALERRLPTICEWRAMASDGCLIGYGPDIAELRLRTADFVVRIFAGGNPAEMPFEQPTRFEMAINNKVARIIGVSVPPSVFVRADEVIE
ncbi:ABC transporter substrate-binding protein [Bradyrhizobium sp. 62]|uniref:ABC transporter substrate-binding protein n=1 Tax=Bradyrhizobium sp. 62 TaxID=1043588 RepID=UPI001FFBDDDC|nr:ABC transporter substrate-binding protein [Bradyrhizobium sp. 62]MCK1368469.1 ABC transporter substrate-binding protein [Bradyrhizobium sp. 62]